MPGQIVPLGRPPGRGPSPAIRLNPIVTTGIALAGNAIAPGVGSAAAAIASIAAPMLSEFFGGGPMDVGDYNARVDGSKLISEGSAALPFSDSGGLLPGTMAVQSGADVRAGGTAGRYRYDAVED